MKVLYAIQSTGNGHISRAKEFIPYLERRFQFDVILSGPKSKVSLDYPVKKHFKGLTLHYSKTGGINWLKTLRKNNFFQFIKDVLSLRVQDYDLVITDFEPVSAWSCYLKGVLCFGLSNQVSIWQKEAPKLKKPYRNAVKYLKYFAPTQHEYGLDYEKFSDNIFSPIIRSKVRYTKSTKGGGIVVYLPAYGLENITACLEKFTEQRWHVFSNAVNEKSKQGNITLHPIDGNKFMKCMAKADGVITNAGFATTSEALFLGKPLLVVPMKGQVEQSYNATVLKKLGITVLKKLNKKNIHVLEDWLVHPKTVKLDFENDIYRLVDQIALDFIKRKFKAHEFFS